MRASKSEHVNAPIIDLLRNSIDPSKKEETEKTLKLIRSLKKEMIPSILYRYEYGDE